MGIQKIVHSSLKFGPLQVAFDETVLHPRPWTLAQSEWAVQLLDTLPPGNVLEVCTGAGHIGLVVAAQTNRKTLLVDAEASACAYAKINVHAAGCDGLVEVRQGRMESALLPDEKFVLIIADPPWVPSEQTARFPEDPLTAIDGGADGLDVARVAVRTIGRHLDEAGWAVLQLGTVDQVGALASAIDSSHLEVGQLREFGRDGVLVSLRHASRESL